MSSTIPYYFDTVRYFLLFYHIEGWVIVFIDSYEKICSQRGVSPTRVLSDLKISKSSYSHWKAGGEPLNETKKKLADYLNVSTEELMSGEIEKPAIQKDDGQVETFKRLFMQVKDQDRLDIIQKMLDMINRK